jgi:cytochrome c553
MNAKTKKALEKSAAGETLTDEEQQKLAEYYDAIREDVARKHPKNETRDLRRAGIG